MAGNANRRRSTFRRAKKSSLGLWTALAVAVLIAAYLAVLEFTQPHVSGDDLRIDTFVEIGREGRIEEATILDFDSYVTGTYTRDDGESAAYNTPYLKQLDDRSLLLGILLDNDVPTTIDQQNGKRVATLAGFMLPGLVIILLFVYLILSHRRGTGLFGIRSGARKAQGGSDRSAAVTFADVAGQDSAVTELKEIKQFLSEPQRFLALGAEVPKGVLLYGPPGCGKTLLARALAAEAGASFFSISGSDFVEVYVGVGAARVRDLFKEARENAPALIFIDELDSVGRARGSGGGSVAHGEQEQALNGILAEMDGFSTTEGVIVLGATNRPDILDPALLRPGRFDRTIGLEHPDEDARFAILCVHAWRKRLAPNLDLRQIARQAIGLTGADLASVMNEAALLAARAGKQAVSQLELDQALQRVLEAPDRQRRLSLRGERSIGRRFTGQERVTFADVAGQDAAVAELQEVKDFLSDPDRFTAVGAVVPRGVLLYGPPGCGKTLLARALAGEANAAFFSVGASEFVEVFVGKGAARVRDLFAEAKAISPAILFIDELDSVGRARGMVGVVQSHGEQEQALNQILAEMDGFSPSDGIIVLGATNRPDVLDAALLRPGRFDRTIGLALPDEKARLSVLDLHSRGKALAPGVDLASLSRRAIGLTGADLANVMNEAALLAVRAGKTTISQSELDKALQRILAAPEEQRRLSLRGKSIGKRSNAETRVTFADVAGVDDAIAELGEVRDYLADPERFTELGARVPRGILLSGPPGCGKTLLARAVAGEANSAFFSVSGSEFVEVFVGEGASRVRELFSEAKSMAPTIVFIDEIDAIGSRRSASASGGQREFDQTLNQILVELDGFEDRSAVIVMAATNRPDMLDPALVRPGRFDRHVAIAAPDRSGRRAILQLHAEGKRLATDVDLDAIAGLTRGFSGADLANVMNEAALLAARQRLTEIPMALMDEGIDRAYLGVASRGSIMSDEERRIVAYHETGHALVALSLPSAIPPHKLTIVPRGTSLGHCTVLDVHDRVLHSRSMLVDRMAGLLGGMVAEEIVFGESTSGPSGDLVKVGEIARRMVRSYGMSAELGSLAYPDEAGGNGRTGRVYSEDSARAIDDEVRRLVEEAKGRARSVLTADRNVLDHVAELLLERESLSSQELTDVVEAFHRPTATALRPRKATPASRS